MLPKTYKVKGKYPPTNRFRTSTLKAWNESDLLRKIQEQGLVEPLEITPIPDEPATERQVSYALYLGVDNPEKYSKHDLSYIISRYEDEDYSTPSNDLVAFAESRQIEFSKFIGKKALYNLVFSTLNDKDKLAFYALCVYRSVTDEREGNLDTHKHKKVFFEFAEYVDKDPKIKNKILRSQGERIRYFGNFKAPDGQTYKGSSTQSLEFKMALAFLREKLGLKDSRFPSARNRRTQPNYTLHESSLREMNIGCLMVIAVWILVIIYMVTH